MYSQMLSSPSSADGIDMEVTNKQQGQRVKPAVQCVGGTGNKPTEEQVGLLQQRNCFPYGNASTEPECNYEGICGCEVGAGILIKLNVFTSISAGWPHCLGIHVFISVLIGAAEKAQSVLCEGNGSARFANITVSYRWVYW